MTERVNRDELAKLVSERLKEQDVAMTITNAKKAILALEDIIPEQVKEGKNVFFNGKGSFKVVERAPRTMTLVGTGEKKKIPAKKAIKFVPSEGLKKYINK